jgi:hypothetical protein
MWSFDSAMKGPSHSVWKFVINDHYTEVCALSDFAHAMIKQAFTFPLKQVVTMMESRSVSSRRRVLGLTITLVAGGFGVHLHKHVSVAISALWRC